MKNEMEEFNMLYENKKELLQLVLNNKSAERIPIGFWWHFAHGDDLIFGYKSVKTIRSIIEAHKKMYDVFSPDFMKIMSDGFFAHPSLIENNVTSISDISKVKPIHKNHPWIREQVAMVAELSNYVGKNIMLFYNIFSPLQSIRLNVKYLGGDAEAFQDMAVKYPEKLIKICEIIASDYALLAEELKNNTSIDGIYYSVQNLQHKKVDKLFHENYVMPIELNLLNQLNSFWEYNLLHICGYDHFKNKLDYYTKYKAKAYNWAVHTDKISLKEGKRLFDSAVIGGFDNNQGTLLDSGSLDDIEMFVHQLIKETGREGLILGADCTIPSDIDITRLKFIRSIAK